MNDTPENQIDAVRREIDRIDETILSLVAERLRVADRMNGLKSPSAGLPIRSGREVAMLRRLIANAQAPIERELVVEIWRALIAAGLRRQRVIDVYVGGGRADPTKMFDTARRHFGARARISFVGEPQAALQKVVEKPYESVAVTAWPTAPGVGSWWPALTESRFHALRLISGLPVLGPIDDDPTAAVFAACDNEEAGNDVSLLLAFDPHHRLQRALKEVNLTGREIGRSEPRVIVRVDGFLAHDDARASALNGHGLEHVRVLGSYARV
jgi:chorismate mutase